MFARTVARWFHGDTRRFCAARRRFQPQVEVLEGRDLPATVTWTNMMGGDWNTP